MDTELVRDVARGLRYYALDHLVGLAVAVRDLATLEDDVRLALGPDLPAGCRLVGPEARSREKAVAKYSILDLRFSFPAEPPAGAARGGVSLLRELGFLPGGGVGPQQRVCDDPLCLEMLQGDIAEGRLYLRLLLEGGRPGEEARPVGPDGQATFWIPEGYLPRDFRVVDACVTNAPGIWLWKHFYC